MGKGKGRGAYADFLEFEDRFEDGDGVRGVGELGGEGGG
jgi:hypothetical protein